jgi:hypothetical protein
MVYFQTNNPNLGKIFVGLRLENVDINVRYGHLEYVFYGHLGYFMTIWYNMCSFATFFPVLVSCTKKNLATLVQESPIC